MTKDGPIYAVIPVKDPAFGKTRLAPLMDARERRALCLFLAETTLKTCAEAFGAEHAIVVTAASDVARIATKNGLTVVDEDSGLNDLNTAIRLGAAHAIDRGAKSLLVVPSDLALISVAELRAAAQAIPQAPGCLIVPDRRMSGTNLLGLTPVNPGLVSFGEQSLQRHAALAVQAGCEVRIHHSVALALDLDLPEDYAAWRVGRETSQDRAEASVPEARHR